MFRMFSERVWRLGLVVGLLGCAGCGLTLSPPGFVHEHRFGLCRGWFDFNSHRRPSFTFERYNHLPPNSARVKLFRWRHGGSVERVPEIEFRNETSYATYDSFGIPHSERCREAGPSLTNDHGEEPLNAPPEAVPPPPAPPSEFPAPNFPEFNLPNPELDGSIVTLPTEAANDRVHLVSGVSKAVDVPQDPSCADCNVPFLPPPPAPIAE